MNEKIFIIFILFCFLFCSCNSSRMVSNQSERNREYRETEREIRTGETELAITGERITNTSQRITESSNNLKQSIEASTADESELESIIQSVRNRKLSANIVDELRNQFPELKTE